MSEVYDIREARIEIDRLRDVVEDWIARAERAVEGREKTIALAEKIQAENFRLREAINAWLTDYESSDGMYDNKVYARRFREALAGTTSQPSPALDLNAPFDAPLRMEEIRRKQRDEQENELAREFMASPEFAEMVRRAYGKAVFAKVAESVVMGAADNGAAPQPSADALDAARYRWLRQMIYDDRIIVAADRMLHGDALDAAIDAARAATPPAQPSAVQRPYVAYNDRGEPCENGLLPDGPRCPRCGGPRGVSGVDGGSWVHYPSKRPTDKR